MTKKLPLIAFIVIFAPIFAMAQGARYDNFASTINTAGGIANLMQVLPGAKITVCGFPGTGGTPCTNLATTYTDQTVTVACGGSTQVVLQGTSSCVANGDSFGNFGFWVKPGSYTYCISATGATTQCYTIVISGSVASSGVALPGLVMPLKFTLVFAGNGNGPTTVGDANQPVITGTQSNFTPTATEPAGRNLFTGAGASVNVTAGYEQGFGANPGQGNYTYGTVSRYTTRLKLFGNTNVRYWIGITDGQTADLNGASATWATDTPNRYYCAFRFSSTTDTTIKAVCATDNTHQTVADTTVAVDTTNSQLFEILPTTSGYQFYINGALTNTITTNTPPLANTLGSLWTVDNKNTANNVGGAIMWSLILLNK